MVLAHPAGFEPTAYRLGAGFHPSSIVHFDVSHWPQNPCSTRNTNSISRFIIPSYNAPFLAVFCRVLRFKLANLLAERQRDTNSLKGLLREKLPLIREVGLRPASFCLGGSAKRWNWCITCDASFLLWTIILGRNNDVLFCMTSRVILTILHRQCKCLLPFRIVLFSYKHIMNGKTKGW